MSRQQKKRRIPQAAGTITDLPKHEQKKLELFKLHNEVIPLKCIYVDRNNGVILFKNPETNGWCSYAESVLHHYQKPKGGTKK